MKQILIIEDEKPIREFIKIGFERSGYSIMEAATGEDGIRKAREQTPDMVILDIILPGIDGFDVCKTLRQEFPRMGIIMLTARNLEMDRIMGLEYGADDYVVKPFNPLELILRAEAILKRLQGDSQTSDRETLASGPFKIATYSQKVYKNGMEIELTPKEYLLLETLISHPNVVMSKDKLLDVVWGYEFDGDSKSVDVQVHRLRKKIEDDPAKPRYIETVWGIGYRWKER